MASEEAIPFGSPPFRLSDLGPCELSWSTPSYSSRFSAQMWVFWSKNNDELRHVKPQLRASDTFSGDAVTKEKIKCILQKPTPFGEEKCLVQFWGLVKIGDKRYLTTCDQPFALALSYVNLEDMKRLCEYRKLSLDYLIPVPEIITQEEQLGPPGRVFYSGLPEFITDSRDYSRKDYPLHDYAVNRVKGYWALPVKQPPENFPVGVLEIISTDFIDAETFMKVLKGVSLCERIKDHHLICHSYYIRRLNSCQIREIARINKVLEVVRNTHRLPLAQTWMLANSVKSLAAVGPESYVNGLRLWEFIYAVGIVSCINRPSLWEFTYASRRCLIPPGQGVVGKAMSSKSSCFCSDIKQLSTKEYPLVPRARKSGLSGCFAVCLQSSCSNNCTYTLEFFLPLNETHNGDPRTLLHMLMLTLKEQLQSSFKIASGQELGQRLFVEVIKVSSDDTLDSFEICHTSGSESTLEAVQLHSAGGMIPPDSSSQQLDVVNNSINFVHEQQVGFVGSPPGPELVQNIVSITHQQPNAELDAANRDRDGVSLEQSGNDATALRKRRSSYTLETERGITREILEQNSTKKLEDVAEHLGVSRSTLKRICRNNNIHRWPPHKAKRSNQAVPQQKVVHAANVEEQSRSDATRLQECSSMTVKAAYADYMIKFPLSFSARKTDLEEKVAQRLDLPVGSFKIEYQDEDDDWILVTCDEDLSTTLSTFRSLGRTTLKMLVK